MMLQKAQITEQQLKKAQDQVSYFFYLRLWDLFKSDYSSLFNFVSLHFSWQLDRVVTELEKSRDLTRVIVHVDMDAFYAAVEMRDCPELMDKPMAVGSMSMLVCWNATSTVVKEMSWLIGTVSCYKPVLVLRQVLPMQTQLQLNLQTKMSSLAFLYHHPIYLSEYIAIRQHKVWLHFLNQNIFERCLSSFFFFKSPHPTTMLGGSGSGQPCLALLQRNSARTS